MTTNEVVAKAEHFANEFIAKLNDTNIQPQRKQVFFMDNQDDLKKYMGALQKIINSFKEEDATTEEEDNIIINATDIIQNLKNAIAAFQAELTVDPELTEEDSTATLTEETITDAMKTNQTTQEISANMAAIAEQQKVIKPVYNYALSCDGQLSMISANTKDELVSSINTIANQGSYKNIQLYKMKFTPVPLKTQTILTI